MHLFSRKYQHLKDEDLLERHSAKPNVVLELLYDRYKVLTLGLAMKYLKDEDKAKDAVSEIFIKLRNEIPKRKIDSFRSWFYVFSKNYCLEVIRKEARRRTHEEKYSLLTPAEAYDHSIDLAIDQLNEVLPQLSVNQRECVQKFYLEKKSYAEISGLLSMPLKQVKSNIQNGKRNLLIKLRSNQNPS